nr:hypothetical protein Iba_chr11aCG16830 [Ipomoea batatas]
MLQSYSLPSVPEVEHLYVDALHSQQHQEVILTPLPRELKENLQIASEDHDFVEVAFAAKMKQLSGLHYPLPGLRLQLSPPIARLRSSGNRCRRSNGGGVNTLRLGQRLRRPPIIPVHAISTSFYSFNYARIDKRKRKFPED